MLTSSRLVEHFLAERSLRLERITILQWISTTLWVAAIVEVFLGLQVLRALYTLLVVEILLEVPLKWLLLFLLKRNGQWCVSVMFITVSAIVCALHLFQFIYHASLFGGCKLPLDTPEKVARCSFPLPELRVLSFFTITLFLVTNIVMLVFVVSFHRNVIRRHQRVKINSDATTKARQSENGVRKAKEKAPPNRRDATTRNATNVTEQPQTANASAIFLVQPNPQSQATPSTPLARVLASTLRSSGLSTAPKNGPQNV